MPTFTTAFVRGLKPRATMFELTCDALPGFILRVLPSGKKVFLIRYRNAGRNQRARIGVWGPSLSVEAARRDAALKLANVTLGEPAQDVSAPSRVKSTPVKLDTGRGAAVTPDRSESRSSEFTMRVLVERFIHNHVDVHLKPGSAKNYRSLLKNVILPCFGHRDVRTITRAEVQTLHASLKATPGKANYVLCVLGSIYTRIIYDWELAEIRNPVTKVRLFKTREVERFLTPAERQRLEGVMETGLRLPAGRRGHLEPASVWAIKLLALTGLRRDEIRDLQWQMINWQHGHLDLLDTKTGPRKVPVSMQVLEFLHEIHDRCGNPSHGYVAASRTGRRLSCLNYTWQKIRKAAGIPDVRLHDLRHSFASDAISNGVPLAVVGGMLGHRSVKTTQRYAHLANHVVRDALEVTADCILEATKTIPATAQPVFEPLHDAQWAMIEPIILSTRGPGGASVDMRRVVDGIRWVLVREAKWREIPKHYARPTTCWRWYERWCSDGTWERIGEALALPAVVLARRPSHRPPRHRGSIVAAVGGV